MKHYTTLLVLIIAIVCNGRAYSEYIAQISIQQADSVDNVYIKLLEDDAPLTVQNFRNYASDGDYTNSFIHRSVPGFVVQGGGYTFDPTLNDGSFTYDPVNDIYPGGLQKVPEDASIDNEFGNSNLQGTLAMAKIAAQFEDVSGVPCFPESPTCILVPGTGPDSATSQWFVNLVDNTFLDTQNGGYTVFAEVLGNGMDVIDVVAGQTNVNRSDIHFAFDSIPLLNFTSDPVVADNLVRINSISEVLSVSPDISYSSVTPGSNLQPEIVIRNIGANPVSIGDIGVLNPLSPPFGIVSDLCANRVLSPEQRCSFIALFSPETSGVFNDSFDIALPGLGINYEVKLSGTGGPDAVEADFSSEFSSVDFGVKGVLFNPEDSPYQRTSTIRNFGDAQLDLYAMALSPDSDSEFALSGSCLDVNSLAPDESCKIKILYFPLVDGVRAAKLIIESNDPDESPFEIPIFAAALSDSDGVDVVVEDAAPNNGDGNNDGALDSQQSNVVSLPDFKGTYITYISEFYQPLMDVRIVNQNTTENNPDNVILESGIHEFTLNNIASNAIVDVGLLLPAGIVPSAYYVYGPTPESSTPQWYKFDFEGETGASFIGIARFTSPTGNTVERNVVLLKIKNGGHGDSSNEQDNTITVISGIKYSNSDSGGGGLLSSFFLQIITLTLLFLRASQCFCRQRPY